LLVLLLRPQVPPPLQPALLLVLPALLVRRELQQVALGRVRLALLVQPVGQLLQHQVALQPRLKSKQESQSQKPNLKS
jgi:hypothetical protein